MNFAIRIANLLAFDVPLYRNLYVNIGGAIASLLGQGSVYSYKARLRGLLYKQEKGVHPRYIGEGIRFIGKEKIYLGDNLTLYGFSYLNAGRKGYINIGKNTTIDVYCVLYGQGGLSIGDYCAIASGVTIYSQTNQYNKLENTPILDQPVHYDQVKIGSDVWIGANATILPGVTIGDGAVIGACSLVRNNVENGSIIAGIPGKKIGDRH